MSIAGGAAAAAQPFSYRATVVDGGGGLSYLYLRSSAGSLAPVSTFKGNNIQRLQASTTVPFRFEIAPTGLAQAFFSRLLVLKTSGAWAVLPSSGSGVVYTADSGLGTTLWEYGALATDQVWTAAGSYGVLIFP